MGSRILKVLAISAVLLVAACSHKDDGTSLGTNGKMDQSATATSTPVEQAPAATGGPTPGTEQDLVVNVGDRVFFALNQHDLSAEARATVEKQAAWLKTYPHINVSIEGHCDERGTREYNLALGEKRANSVKTYLVSLGVDAGRLQTISYGKERPAVTGSDETAWAQNRRAVLVVQ